MIAGVLWDLDGIIADTSELHYQSWRQALLYEDLIITRELFHPTFGMNNHSIIAKLGKGKINTSRYNSIIEKKEAIFRNQVTGIVKFPFVDRCLQLFKDSGVPQAIASSAPIENINAIIHELNLENCFDALISGSGLPGKPNPTTFLIAAKKLGVNPLLCLVIEDSIHGITAAREAGMFSVAITNSFSREKLQGADLVFDSLQGMIHGGIIKLWESLSKK